MNAVIKLLDKILSYALITAMASILLVVSWQVVSRYLLDDPSSVTEELARFLLIWIGMLGAVYAFRTHAHLGLDIVVDRMQPAKKHLVQIFVQVSVIVFCALVMVYGGTQLMDLTLDLNQISAALGIKMGFVYSILPITGGMICLYAIHNIGCILRGEEEGRH